MISRIKNSLIFRLEQVMVRGALSRFALMLVLVGLVALIAGILIRQLVPGFESLGDAVWWAFEHIVVPEYVDGDEGVAKLTVGTVLIVIGSILFAGAVIAILVQWLNETIEHLQLGLTPVTLDAHIVLAGWTSRTQSILEEILASQGRVERFLRRRGVRRLHVVLLAGRADARLRERIRLQLGERWNPRQIILRSGTPLLLEDLERVDFAHAAVIVMPAADTTATGSLAADTQTVKALMTIGDALAEAPPEELPLVVVEIQDPRHMDTLRALYKGPMEIITGDEVISRLVVQTVRHPGLSHVFTEFTTDLTGSQIYLREEPQLAGVSVQQLVHAFPKGVLVGVVRPRGEGFQALLNPPKGLLLEKEDLIAVLASSREDAAPPATIAPALELPERPAAESVMRAQRRVLVLGWNHRVPAILREFTSYPGEEFIIDIVSQVSAAKRKKRIDDEELSTERLKVRQLEFDYTVPAYLEDVDLASYDNVVLLASERFKSGTESDARTILGYLVLRKLMTADDKDIPVLVELTNPIHTTLFDNRRGEVIVTPLMVSHMLTRVALRREMRALFDEVFTSGGTEIFFHRISDYGLVEILSQIPDYELTGNDYNFADLQRAADARGEIAIGIRRAGQQQTPHGGVELNPRRDASLQLNQDDELIVLATYE